jgi:hypothetical protein
MTDMAARGELVPDKMASLAAEYGAEVDLSSVPRLVATHGLTFPAGPAH